MAIHRANNGADKTNAPVPSHQLSPVLLTKFLAMHSELESYKNGKLVTVDGETLSIAAVTAVARYRAKVQLDDSPATKDRTVKSRKCIADKIDEGQSIYGLSTGFGGSADSRTNKPQALGHACLQHQHIGILPSSTQPLDVLPLQDPMHTTMPEAWVRGAILVRMNSLIRGHSGVRWELIEKMNELLEANVTPLVPLRASISASGDLSPLSYIAGTLVANPIIRVMHGPVKFGTRQISSAVDALKQYGIEPLPLLAKEHLGIINGTAFSAAIASLALNDAVHLALLAQVCTAMGTEALCGTRGSFHPFIHNTARPHPGQVECAGNLYNLLEGSKFAHLQEQEITIDHDRYLLRQDRYPLRTAPQFLGPQIEDILAAYYAVTQECNSTTDNPLVDGETGQVHHGGNFQAMAVSNAMEKTRLALHHIGKLLFTQSTEVLNPAMNNGLPPSLAASDPSLNYYGKGVDVAIASYVSELGFLASPVTTHIQSAEMHNQAINSLALISARATINALEVLSSLTASYLYLLCQALDLRALQAELATGLRAIIEEELLATIGSFLSLDQQEALIGSLYHAMVETLDKTTVMDAVHRMDAVAASAAPIIISFLSKPELSSVAVNISSISQFREKVASRGADLLNELRTSFLTNERGPAPASPYLNKTRGVYEFVRLTLGVRMHGIENHAKFKHGLNVDEESIGQGISRIYEAIRDSKIQGVIVSLFP